MWFYSINDDIVDKSVSVRVLKRDLTHNSFCLLLSLCEDVTYLIGKVGDLCRG